MLLMLTFLFTALGGEKEHIPENICNLKSVVCGWWWCGVVCDGFFFVGGGVLFLFLEFLSRY